MKEDLETPAAVVRLAVAARADLAGIRSLFEEGAVRLDRLEESVRVLPDSRAAMRGWRLQAEELCRQMAEEADTIARKLTGEGADPIAESVNREHSAAVINLRREA